jgi:hypothetical protein
MSAERHIRKMNRLLLAELGENPLYQWIHSESAEFKRAMRVVDDAGKPEFDFRCPCGLNVSVHSAACSPPTMQPNWDREDGEPEMELRAATTSSLVVAEPKWEIRKTDPALVDQWVLCCLQIPMSEHEWKQTFGTRLPYPKNGTWAPVETETRIVAMPPHTLPGENFTMACIRGRQRSREIKASDIANAFHSREQKKDEQRQEKIRYRISDALPVNPYPGTRSGNVSLPEVVFRPKRQPGENLVTL